MPRTITISLPVADLDASKALYTAMGGGTPDINPVQDHAFMYGRDFADPDGHVWGAMWMDVSASFTLV